MNIDTLVFGNLLNDSFILLLFKISKNMNVVVYVEFTCSTSEFFNNMFEISFFRYGAVIFFSVIDIAIETRVAVLLALKRTLTSLFPYL